MESILTPQILDALVAERYRLEALLRPNPIYQRLEALCHMINVYEASGDGPTQAALTSRPDSQNTRPSDPPPGPSPSDQISSPRSPSSAYPQRHTAPSQPAFDRSVVEKASRPRYPTPSDASAKPRRGGWKRGDSETSRIRDAAVSYLRETRKRVSGAEIYRAIASKGVTVSGQKPQAVVAARLSASHLFDRTEEGYGLREWSNGSR